MFLDHFPPTAERAVHPANGEQTSGFKFENGSADTKRLAYPEFFQTYPDAQRKDNEAIRNVVKAKTDLGQTAADRVVRTFRSLVSQADFDGVEDLHDDGANGDENSGSREDESGGKVKVQVPNAPTIAINIQLALPPDADDETYEKLFAAMSKHLPL